MDVYASFWLQAFLYAIGLAAIFYIGLIAIPKKSSLRPAVGLGLSLLAGAVALFLITVFLLGVTTAGRGYGAIVLFIYPAIDILLAVGGLAVLIIYGLSGRSRKEAIRPSGPDPEASAALRPEGAAGSEPAPEET